MLRSYSFWATTKVSDSKQVYYETLVLFIIPTVNKGQQAITLAIRSIFFAGPRLKS